MAIQQMFLGIGPSGPGIEATGGTTFEPGNGYYYHVFTTPGPNTFTVTANPLGSSFEYALVGGGGRGEAYSPTLPQAGEDTTAFGFTAYGGGGGGNYPANPGQPGGSGGGGGDAKPWQSGSPAPGGTGVAGQGNPGGSGAAVFYAGGGGGAGGAGSPGAPPSTGGVGGIGTAVFAGDTGIPPSYGTPGPSAGRWVAGGGGGSWYQWVAGGAGGGGWGYNGTLPTPYLDRKAVINTGGGGGGNPPSGIGPGGSGGAGAGGYLTGSVVLPATSYTIVIGEGSYPIGTFPSTGPPWSQGAPGIAFVRYLV